MGYDSKEKDLDKAERQLYGDWVRSALRGDMKEVYMDNVKAVMKKQTAACSIGREEFFPFMEYMRLSRLPV